MHQKDPGKNMTLKFTFGINSNFKWVKVLSFQVGKKPSVDSEANFQKDFSRFVVEKTTQTQSVLWQLTDVQWQFLFGEAHFIRAQTSVGDTVLVTIDTI